MNKENSKTLDLHRFGAGETVNTTAGVMSADGIATPYSVEGALSDEMRTYYSDYLIDNAEPNLIHDQFAQKHPIPKHGGKTIRFRKYDPLPKLTTALSEGVTPDGQALNMGVVEATVHQYGGYVEFSDLLLLTAVDNNLVMATKLLGSQAGRTLDTITREVLCGGTNVQYAADDVDARYLLCGGQSEGNHYMSVECIKRAVRSLKNQNAEKINGAYACIIHPDCAYDLTNDPCWKFPHQYADTKALYEGEIGMIEGVRFVESTEAKVFHAPDLCAAGRAVPMLDEGYMESDMFTDVTEGLTSQYILTVKRTDAGADFDQSIVGRALLVYDASEQSWQYVKVCGYYTNHDGTLLYLDRPLVSGGVGTETFYASNGDMIYPGEAGLAGRDVYATILLGENAYGTTELTDGGLQHIVKQLGSGGTADPLDQRATVGWKATKAAVRLMEPFMVRIETASSFESNEI